MKVYLSHGLGVNSWALYLYLIEQGEIPGEDFEAVAVNHHTDWPESYEYLEMMLAKGYPVTVIEVNFEGHSSIYEYCWDRRIMPSRQLRWCTYRFKVQPITKYYRAPGIELVGFDVSEISRAKGMKEKDGITQEYPLIEAGIDRQGCINLIRRHGLPVPQKSGCFICPFQSRTLWIELRERHPELFCKAQQLERLTNERRASQGKAPIYFRDIPLGDLIQVKDSRGRRATPGQTEMFDSHDRPPCRCGL